MVLVLAAAVLVWLLELAGAVAPFDGIIYDAALRRLPPPAAEPAVLLIDWGPGLGADECLRAVRQLSALGARQVVFTFSPEAAPPAFAQEAAQAGALIGRAAPPPLAHGVARRGHAGPGALEGDVIRRVYPDRPIPGEFGIRYRGGPGSLPLVTSAALLQGKLVPELVRGRIVLIGRSGAAVWAPTSSAEPMSVLEVSGHAVDCLVKGSAIRPLTPLARLALVLLVAGVSLVLFQRLGVRRAMWGTPMLAALLVGAAAVSLYFGWWPPVLALLLAQAACALIMCAYRAVRAADIIRGLSLELAARERQCARPAGFHEADGPWELLARLAAQVPGVTPQGFLERVPGTKRLRKVADSPADALPAAHYRQALAARAPVFLPARGGEVTALVPLVFEGQVLGLWRLGVGGQPDDALRAQLAAYAEQMAQLLGQRREWHARQHDSVVDRLLAAAGDDADQRSLVSAIGQLERRLGRAERLLGVGSHPTLVSDAFGRAHEVNGPMREWLAAHGAAAVEQPVEQWVASLTRQPAEAVRRVLQGVYRDRQRVALPVGEAAAGKHYLLHIHPLCGLGEPGPFGVSGVVCELVEWTAQARLDALREQMVGHLAVAVRNDLAAVELAAGLLAAADCDGGERQQLGEVITDKVRRVAATFAEAQAGFDAPFEEGARYPVDSAAALREALAAPAPEVQLTQPLVLPFVLAAPGPLSKTFAAVLEFLGRDARPGSPIRVRVDQTERWVRYTFVTTGFGLPPDRLRQLISPREQVKANELAALRHGLRRVYGWGGQVEADSAVGEGMTVTLCLPMFA